MSQKRYPTVLEIRVYQCFVDQTFRQTSRVVGTSTPTLGPGTWYETPSLLCLFTSESVVPLRSVLRKDLPCQSRTRRPKVRVQPGRPDPPRGRSPHHPDMGDGCSSLRATTNVRTSLLYVPRRMVTRTSSVSTGEENERSTKVMGSDHGI